MNSAQKASTALTPERENPSSVETGKQQTSLALVFPPIAHAPLDTEVLIVYHALQTHTAPEETSPLARNVLLITLAKQRALPLINASASRGKCAKVLLHDL